MSGYGRQPTIREMFVCDGPIRSDNFTTGLTNLQESVLKKFGRLGRVLDLFNATNVDDLDDGDLDFGSGGVMVLPDQAGATPILAVAAGKLARCF